MIVCEIQSGSASIKSSMQASAGALPASTTLDLSVLKPWRNLVKTI